MKSAQPFSIHPGNNTHMTSRTFAFTLLAAATLTVVPLRSLADYTNSLAVGDTNAVDVDNSAKNTRDRNDQNLTPGDQGTSQDDIQTTRNIRKALVAKDSGYSITAQNIKIITVNGRVALRGPVTSDHEKSGILSLAQRIAGEGNVTDQLEVKNNP